MEQMNDSEEVQAEIMTLLAGDYADLRLDRQREKDARLGAQSDFEKIEELLPLADAKMEELEAIEGIGKKQARIIFEHLKNIGK